MTLTCLFESLPLHGMARKGAGKRLERIGESEGYRGSGQGMDAFRERLRHYNGNVHWLNDQCANS